MRRFAVVAVLVVLLAVVQPSQAATSGTFSLTNQVAVIGDSLVFTYRTDAPDASNWVALYDDPGKGPSDQKYHAPSSTWDRAPKASGTLSLSSAKLTAGHDIVAYFLAKDGYTWLAPPVTFQLKLMPPYDGGATGPHWVTDAFTVGTAPPGSKVSLPVSGLWFGKDDKPVAAPTLSKTGGDDWLSLGSDGVITGTAPTAREEPYRIEVLATDSSGAHAALNIDVPVGKAAVIVKTATLEAWNGGGHVNNPVEKLTRTVLLNRLDLLGLQDSSGLAAKVAARLSGGTAGTGWQSSENLTGNAILSRYPMQAHVQQQQPAASAATSAAAADLPAIHATIQLGDRTVSVWSANLDEADYAPAIACGPAAPTADALVQKEATTKRFAQVRSLVKVMASDIATKTPTILFGSLASPSSVDWTAAVNRCGAGEVAWPVPAQLSSAGLTDVFRTANPDPTAVPGVTNTVAGTTAIPDRTDYLFASGPIKAVESHVLVDGFPQPLPDTLGNAWISNHAAVVGSFELLPAGPEATDSESLGVNPNGPVAENNRQSAEQLATTGAEPWPWLLLAVMLITLGGVVLIANGNICHIFRGSTWHKQKA